MYWATLTVWEIMDALILEQFLQNNPENIWIWVRRYQPDTLDAAVKLTEEFAEVDLPWKKG